MLEPCDFPKFPQPVREVLERAAAQEEAARPKPTCIPGWPEGVLARYITVAGALVDVRETGPRDDDGDIAATFAECHGCPQYEGWEWNTHPRRGVFLTISWAAAEAEQSARRWAQEHAEFCRALPQPEARKEGN